MTFPFSAIVGQQQLRTALLLTAVDPGIGGVLVRGQKGTAKTTAVRALASLLPPAPAGDDALAAVAEVADVVERPVAEGRAGHRPARLVELPVGATEDRLAGSLDVEAALAEGRPRFRPGLLAEADRGVLYVDEVNLLGDHLVDLLLDAAATGTHRVERDGLSVEHPARLQLVGSMNPEEGELRPQLLDRFGLSVEVIAPADRGLRAEVVRRRLAHDADPAGFAARFAEDERALADAVIAARSRLGDVSLSDRELGRIVQVCAHFEVEGLRADLVIARAARAAAAWEGAGEVGVDHVRTAARLALPHRRRRAPFEQPGLDEEELERALRLDDEDDADDDEDHGGGDDGGGDGSHDPGPTPGTGPEAARPPPGRGAGDGGDAPPPVEPTGSADESAGPRAHDTPTSAPDHTPQQRDEVEQHPGGPAGERGHAVGATFTPARLELPGTGRGSTGRRSAAEGPRGTVIGARRPAPGERPHDLHLPATVRAAALTRHAPGEGAHASSGLRVRPEDLRTAVRRGREGNLLVLVVDASGSAGARRRMVAVKGAVHSLLLDAYRRRDRLALVAFRGHDAEVVVPPTASPELADRRLADLRTGGRTPLAAGLRRAAAVVAAEARREPDRRPLVITLTDGRANAGPDAREQARRAAGSWLPAACPGWWWTPRTARCASGWPARSPPRWARPVCASSSCPRPSSAPCCAGPRPPPRIARRAEPTMSTEPNTHDDVGGGVSDYDGASPERTADTQRRRRKRETPLLMVHTGDGKGKSTAAFGMMLRAWNQGWPIAVYQFVKSGKWRVGEHAAAETLGGIDWFKMGDGWSWTSRDLETSAELAREGWAEVKRCLAEERYRFYLLDEFTYPMQWGWVDTEEVVETLRARPAGSTCSSPAAAHRSPWSRPPTWSPR
jgi:magnesium chelatase subunit D